MCLLSYIRAIRVCLPSMRRLGSGRIVNSTSSSVKDCLDNLILSNTMRANKAGISVADYEKEDLKAFPLGRYGTVDEYGRLAAFLCSGANTYISGQIILLDGAMTRAY